jgi:hypothetical protein
MWSVALSGGLSAVSLLALVIISWTSAWVDEADELELTQWKRQNRAKRAAHQERLDEMKAQDDGRGLVSV